MSDRVAWVLLAVVLVAVFGALALLVISTEPRCPSFAMVTWTRSGWYCTVAPL